MIRNHCLLMIGPGERIRAAVEASAKACCGCNDDPWTYELSTNELQADLLCPRRLAEGEHRAAPARTSHVASLAAPWRAITYPLHGGLC